MAMFTNNMATQEKYSLIVRQNNKLEVLDGDYEGLRTDGIKSLIHISTHDTHDEAVNAMKIAKMSR